MIDAMTCRELPAASMGLPSRRRCLGTMRQEPFCLAIAVEDGDVNVGESLAERK